MTSFPNPDDGVDVAKLHAQRFAAQGRRDALIAMVSDGTITQDEVTPQLQAKRIELKQIDEQLARAAQRNPLADLIGVEDVEAGGMSGPSRGSARSSNYSWLRSLSSP